MTQEEKLKEAKRLYESANADQRYVLESLFPELKESEGERIWIINYLSNRILNSTIIAEKENLKKAIDYLEKQGEQKPAEYTLEQAAGIFLDALSNTPYNNKPITDAQVITKELLKFLSDSGSYNPNAINEQNPAWSKEDEEALEVAIIALEDMYSEDSPLDCYAGHHMPFDKAANQLKSIKERVACEVNCTTIKEWSEEDRKIIIELIGIFESAVDGGHVSFPYRLIKDYIRVLKSCLSQSTWKPSDEQLKMLDKTIGVLDRMQLFGGRNALIGLKHDLKKLREE